MIAIAITVGAVVGLAFEAGILAQSSILNWPTAIVAITVSIVGLLTLIANIWFQIYRDREARRARAEEKAATDTHRQLVLDSQAAQIELLLAAQKQLTEAKNEVKNEVTTKAEETQKVVIESASPPPPPPLQVFT